MKSMRSYLRAILKGVWLLRREGFKKESLTKIACLGFIGAFSVSVLAKSSASLHGSVRDELGVSIVGATITLTDSNGVTKTATTDGEGGYSFLILPPGK